VAPNTPDSLLELVHRCLKKPVADRHQRLDDVRRAIVVSSSPPPAIVGTEARREKRPFPRGGLGLTRSRSIVVGTIAALIAVVVLAFFYLTTASLEGTDSVVLLPFENVEKDADLEYVADRLSESITKTLSRLSSVRVIARATAFTYEGKSTDVRRLGQELSVRTIVMGRVSRARDRLRVQAELVDARAGTQMWGQHYEGHSEDLLRIQDDVVRSVSHHLRVDGIGASREQLTRASRTKRTRTSST
jgi:TolB-like protein